MKFLNLQLKNYTIKKTEKKKKAVSISFIQPVTRTNVNRFRELFRYLIKKNFDIYIINLNNKEIITGYTIKLILALNNTKPRSTGIIVSDNVEDYFYNTKLNNYFIAEKTIKPIIINIENKKR